MNENKENSFLGLDLIGPCLRVIEVQKHNGNYFVSNAAEAEMDFSFDFESVADPQMLPMLVATLNDLKNQIDFASKDVRLAINRRLVLLKTVPIDKGMNEFELSQQIAWEANQLLIDNRKEFNIGYEVIGQHHTSLNHVMFVAVRKAVIDFIKNAFQQADINLNRIDIDVLANLRALNYIVHNKEDKGLTAIIKCERSLADISVYFKDDLITLRELPSINSEAQEKTLLDAPADELAALYNEELSKVLKFADTIKYPTSYSNIFLFGGTATMALKEQLFKLNKSVEVTIIPPFEDFSEELSDDKKQLISDHPEKYFTSFGMAIV